MARPSLTGGQRAASALAGLVNHALFSIGWFGLAFVLFFSAFGGVLQALVGSVDAATLSRVFASIGSIIWMVVVVFGVGSAVFVVLAVILSERMLRRGEVNRPWGVTVLSLIISAIIDVPIWLLSWVISRAATQSEAGLAFLPPLFSLILLLVTGALVWWWMAHVLRAKAPVDPATLDGHRVVAVPVEPGRSGGGDATGEAADPVEQPR